MTAGVTPSERYLSRLAAQSFLSLWSHSNLYTDEGRKNGKGNGKELCDLMVVFGNHVLLFSDKHCAYPAHENVQVAWSRWYRRTIVKSVRQLLGAEYWLRRFADRVFLDAQCTRKFPLSIPNPDQAVFHRFAVTRGGYEKCREHFAGQSTGSLVINTAITGSAHEDNPFNVGIVAPGRGYIHVLDELTLEVLLKELDTIPDFITYLKKKELLLTKSGRVVMASGEEQLVSRYLTTLNTAGEHDFGDIPDNVDTVYFSEGHWEDFIRNPQYLAKKRADEPSYIWDRLIEHFVSTHNTVGYFGSAVELTDLERALRVLASESRVRRRLLAPQLVDTLQHDVPPGKRFARLGLSSTDPDTAYVFLAIPKPPFVATYEEYRQGRIAMLAAYCKVAKLRAPQARRIVGIASEPSGTGGSSEDLVLEDFDENPWGPEEEAEAKWLQEHGEILLDHRIVKTETRITEWPEATQAAQPASIRRPPAKSGLNRAQRRALARKSRRKGRAGGV